MDRTLRRFATCACLVSVVQTTLANDRALQTWHPWQLDSVLVAWVLSQAQPLGSSGAGSAPPVFESVPRGAPIPVERAIDTPDSPYRRTAQRTAFEEAVRLTGFKHNCFAVLRDAVRVVELAPWRKPEFPTVEEFEARVLRAIPQQPRQGGLEAALTEVDRYCKETRDSKENKG
jgi:hypothetical protein